MAHHFIFSPPKSLSPLQVGSDATEDVSDAVMEHILWPDDPYTYKWRICRNYCKPTSADSSVYQEVGQWLEEDRTLPFKKRRILLNSDAAPSNTITVSQNARTGRRCTVKKRATDHVLFQDHGLIKGSPEMVKYPTAEDTTRELENMVKSYTCSNGQGWRCKQPRFAGYAFCEHHLTLSRTSWRRKNEMKKKKTGPSKIASLKLKAKPISSYTNADHVFYKDDHGLKGSPEMIKCQTAEDIAKEETINICDRRNGQGWRCKLPCFAGSAFCEHHLTLNRDRRRKNGKKKKESNPSKITSSKVKAISMSSYTKLEKLAGSTSKIEQCINYTDPVFDKSDDFEVISGVMVRTLRAAKGIKEEEINMDDDIVIATTRCSRTDGKRWRCSQPSFGGSSLCQLHLANKRKTSMKKKNQDRIPHKVASSKVKISPSSPTTLVHTEMITTIRFEGERESKNVLIKEAAEVAEKIKMEGETTEVGSTNSTTRCSRASGKGWRCSQPRMAGSSLCEHHRTLIRNRRIKENKKMELEVKITLNSPTITPLQGKNMDINGSAKKGRSKCLTECKDSDFKGVAGLMMNGTIPATKEIKMEAMDNITLNPRCSRSNGKGWKCSKPCSAGYPLCHHHWADRNNTSGKEEIKEE